MELQKTVDSQLSAKLVLVEKKLENKIENKIVDIKDNMESAEIMSKEEIKDVVKQAYKEERQREIRKANMMQTCYAILWLETDKNYI